MSQGLSRQGEGEIPESSSKQRHGHLRHGGIHSLRHHPGTKDTIPYGIVSMYSILEPRTRFHWPLFLISSHIMRGCYTDTDTIQVVFQAQCSRQKLCIFAVMYTRWALSQHLSQIYPLTAQQTDRWDGPKEYRTAAHSFQARARNQSFVVGFCLVRA